MSKSMTTDQMERIDSEHKSSVFTGGNKSTGPAPLLTTSPSLKYQKDPKDQIIKSLQESLTLALKNVSSLQVELTGM
jgi:hypothetical protein